MQALTSPICKTVPVGTEGLLKDTRDGKTYWVARLKDNNCWMTQNLDYDDTSSTKVSAPSGWTSTDANYRAYYDPGNWVYTNKIPGATACPNSAVGPSGCIGYGFTNADGMRASENPAFQGSIVYLDEETAIYNAHYHIGNYYSFQSATNGTGSSATTAGANASGSICPTNWKLPTSNNTNSGSFGGLTNSYSIGNNAAGASTISTSPLYFTSGGHVSSGALNSAGNSGYYWSSTAYSSTSAYDLYFASSLVNPSYHIDRYVGASVRCLVETDSTGGAIWT